MSQESRVTIRTERPVTGAEIWTAFGDPGYRDYFVRAEELWATIGFEYGLSDDRLTTVDSTRETNDDVTTAFGFIGLLHRGELVDDILTAARSYLETKGRSDLIGDERYTAALVRCGLETVTWAQVDPDGEPPLLATSVATHDSGLMTQDSVPEMHRG